MLSDERFLLIFGREPEDSVFCPYRICPLGAHVDHNRGIVTGFAIDRGVSIAFEKTGSTLTELRSMQFPETVTFELDNIPAKKAGDWADYLRGAAKELAAKGELGCGIRAVIHGSLPIGGLSSSAAVTLAFIAALCRVNNIKLSGNEAVELARKAESDYVGVGVGILDQSCEIFSKKNRLLVCDTLTAGHELFSKQRNAKAPRFGIFFSGVSRALINSDYNLRVSELKEAAKMLCGLGGIETEGEIFMRRVPAEIYREFGSALPEKLKKRAEHYFSEQERVAKGIEAWKKGDMLQFGALMTESGRSSVTNWEAGSPELKALSEILASTNGVYGARFSGAGFKGSCAALIEPGSEEEIRRSVTERYLALFPQHTELFAVDFCSTANGIKFPSVR